MNSYPSLRLKIAILFEEIGFFFFLKKEEIGLLMRNRIITHTDLHIFNEYSDMQCSTSTDNECIGCFTIFNLHSQISLKFTIKPVP